ncbi:hypothetical protein [Prevotella sp. khp7]|uniref:hypothetical protein n=1 Tax=Prevotella sp. khp7 TaxID=1761885 RepID=UPI000B8097A1|nr:hypothetical protein [Prevotella sp. khp7]
MITKGEMQFNGMLTMAMLSLMPLLCVLKAQPDRSVESFADYNCFNGRDFFHEVFRQYTSMTPAKYQL